MRMDQDEYILYIDYGGCSSGIMVVLFMDHPGKSCSEITNIAFKVVEYYGCIQDTISRRALGLAVAFKSSARASKYKVIISLIKK